jgi:predicted NACHT family NTPase
MASGIIETLFVAFLEKRARKVAASITESATEKSKSKLNEFWKRASFKAHVKNYTEKLKTSVGQIKILGMSRPVELKELYINVYFLNELTAKQNISSENLEYELNQHLDYQTPEVDCQPGLKVIQENDFVTVLGKPGAGKTTFLKYIALTCIEGSSKIGKIPIFISLNELANSETKIQTYINNIFVSSGFESAESTIHSLQADGAFIFLFDGLDEVNEHRLKTTIDEVKKFVHKYNECKFVISCRTAAYNYLFSEFTDVEIADFNTTQVNAFVEKFFSDQPTKKNECIIGLSDPDNKSIKMLCSSPLLLTLLCISFDDGMEFPTSRVDLYEEAIDTLLKKWDTSRQIKRDVIYKQLTYKKKKRLLQEIAFSTFKEKNYFFKKRVAQNLVESFIERMGSGVEDLELDSTVILEAIESQHGLIVQRAYNIYSFSHLTFQEYFASAYICQNTNFTERENLIHRHLTDNRYREIFLLVVGLLDEADEFLVSLRKKISSLAHGNLLFSVLQKTEELISDKIDYPTPIKRAIALKSIIFSIEQFSYRGNRENIHLMRVASASASSLLERMCEIYKRYFSEDLNTAEIRTINYGNPKIRENVFLLKEQVSNLNEKELRSYVIYIQSSKLMMDCMAIDCVAKKSTKKSIVESFLIERTSSTS